MKGRRIIQEKPSKLRTSTNLSDEVLERISASMALGKYGVRQRSFWINEAIEMLAEAFDASSLDEVRHSLKYSATYSDGRKHVNFVLQPSSVEFIEKYKAYVPEDQPVISCVIHFAISYRLMYEKLI